MTDRELMQQALDALEDVADDAEESHKTVDAIEALRTRLAQPEPEPEKSQDKPCVEDDGCPTEKAVLQRFWREHQAQPEPEPVAWWHDRGDVIDLNVSGHGTPLYFAPPQREWQGLTENDFGIWKEPAIGILRWAEAVLRERNK